MPEDAIIVHLSGVNAETFDRADDPTADEDGHVITASVVRLESETSLAPVRVRIGHGVAPDTAVAMLRKMAGLLEKNPDLLSADPGVVARRMPDGTTQRKHLTREDLEAAIESLDEADRKRLEAMLDILRRRDDL
ncbi:MAG: hypothetical protein KDA28_00160 [Phycisphaerales bacterium]|nr:hypothetical protein [Phycisphaerales bacterium]